MKTALLLLLGVAIVGKSFASDVIDVSPITNQIVLVHFKDGHVIHHRLGQRREDEKVVSDPLDVNAASLPGAYRVTSKSDAKYGMGVTPVSIGRKSKGTDFAWHIDRWVVDHAENDAPDHTKEHWIYLYLPSPLRSGMSYSIHTGPLAANGKDWNLTFDQYKSRSESVHVNTIGYAPIAPSKFAYIYHWAGDRGGVDLSAFVGKRFWLIDRSSGKSAFEGRVVFRKPAATIETAQPQETPGGSFLAADVYECDFSVFNKPGGYVVSVEGVGCSWPFQIAPDVYRKPFITVARALYHNRSGIALTAANTSFERPAPHHPGVTPGFKLQYSSLPYLDYGSESGTKEMIMPTLRGPLDAWGWYQDAGDWDSYQSHVRVAQELLLAYELNPKAFAERELNLPESGNGLPDILNEAAWLPRFCQRLRLELLQKHYGTGGIGLRIDGDPFGSDTKPNDVGKGSWQDVDRLWVASGEDPVSTYGYAGIAAHLAFCLGLAGKKDPGGIDWTKEAIDCYSWAASHTRPKDEKEVRAHRMYAAAALFRLTGDKRYEARVSSDAKDAPIWGEDLYGPAVYVLGGRHDANRDPMLLERLRTAITDTAHQSHQSAEKRALRWAGDWGLPMLVGQQTTPLVMEIAVGRAVTKDTEKKRAYTADLYTTCDYFLGTNALNQTWATGLGPRHPNIVFHIDSWYIGDGTPHPGIIPYGPWRKEHENGQGPWDHDWVNKTVYPNIDLWPGNERWFDNRCSPLTGEFTIHQNIAPAAAIFGILCSANVK